MNKNDFAYPQVPPTLAIRKTTNRFLVSNSIYLIITTALISAIDSWSHPLSWFVFAAMVLKFVGSIETKYALILSEQGVRIKRGRTAHWDDLIDFYLEEEVPGESSERLVVLLRGGRMIKVLNYKFVLTDLDADRDRIVEWVRFYGRYFRK